VSKCISTFYIDHIDEHNRMLKTLLHFHPDVTVEVSNKEEFMKVYLGAYAYPTIELPLFKKYSTVTHIDNDVLVLDNIDELFDDSTDARAGRNNSDSGRCATHAGLTLPGIDEFMYVNAGIHSVSSEIFMEDWMKTCLEKGGEIPYQEQGVLNLVFHSGKYNTKILDPKDKPVHWGTSLIEGIRTYWDLWKEINPVGDHLELRGKRIKMLHIAGGGATKQPLINLLNKPSIDFIESILHAL